MNKETELNHQLNTPGSPSGAGGLSPIEFHNWCTKNRWYGNARRLNQDQYEYTSTGKLYEEFLTEKEKAKAALNLQHSTTNY